MDLTRECTLKVKVWEVVKGLEKGLSGVRVLQGRKEKVLGLLMNRNSRMMKDGGEGTVVGAILVGAEVEEAVVTVVVVEVVVEVGVGGTG